MDPRDSRRQADLDWLYGTSSEPIDHTKVMDESELAELERRRDAQARQAARTGAEAAAAGVGTSQPAAERRRVVTTEPTTRARPARRPVNEREPVPAPRPRPAAERPATTAPAAQPRSATRAPRPARVARPGRARRRWRWLAAALVAWLVWLLVVPVIGVMRMGKIQEQPSGDRPPKQPGTTTLLVGSDARENLSKEQQSTLGTGTEVGKRTDTMMLLYKPTTGKPVLVSLPRDSYVSIPGHGRNKLNAAYAMGGPQLLVSAVEQNTGVRVDNYLEVGFDGFANVIDALGGIEMCPKQAIKDKDSHLDLPAGCQDLDGPTALNYVRMRKADPEGDLGRVKRQRQMLSAMTKKAASPITFIWPVRYWRLNMAAGGAVHRGENTGPFDLFGTAMAMRSVSGGGLNLTVPVADANVTTGAGSSVLWDEEKAADLFGHIARGDTSGLEKYAK